MRFYYSSKREQYYDKAMHLYFEDDCSLGEIAAELSGAAVWYLQPFRDAPEVPCKELHAPDPMTMEEFGSIGNRFIKTIIRN